MLEGDGCSVASAYDGTFYSTCVGAWEQRPDREALASAIAESGFAIVSTWETDGEPVSGTSDVESCLINFP